MTVSCTCSTTSRRPSRRSLSPSTFDVRQDLRDHQRGRRAARDRARCRRARVRVRAEPAPGRSRDRARHRAPAPARGAHVGVFRDERPERIVEIVGRAGLHGVQLHGSEPASEVQWIRERVQFVIQAFAAGDPALAGAATSAADIILVDSPDPGSGKVFDWRLAEGAPRGKRILLAGGLTPRTSARRSASCGRGASTCRAASSSGRAARIRASCGGSSTRRARPRRRRRRSRPADRGDRPHRRRGRPASTRPWDWQIDQ